MYVGVVAPDIPHSTMCMDKSRCYRPNHNHSGISRFKLRPMLRRYHYELSKGAYTIDTMAPNLLFHTHSIKEIEELYIAANVLLLFSNTSKHEY